MKRSRSKLTKLLLLCASMAMVVGFAACDKEGVAGPQGIQGIQGIQGETGATGKSAYELYKEKFNYQGTEEEWLSDLVNGKLSTEECIRIKFNANGGEAVADILVPKGESVDLPVATREGYYFRGWFYGEDANGGQVTNVTPITREMTVKAKWEEIPTFELVDAPSYAFTGAMAAIRLYYDGEANGEELTETEVTIIYNGTTYSIFEAMMQGIVKDPYVEFFEADPNLPVFFCAPMYEGEYVFEFTYGDASLVYTLPVAPMPARYLGAYVQDCNYGSNSGPLFYEDGELLASQGNYEFVFTFETLAAIAPVVRVDGELYTDVSTNYENGSLNVMVDLCSVHLDYGVRKEITVTAGTSSATIGYTRIEDTGTSFVAKALEDVTMVFGEGGGVTCGVYIVGANGGNHSYTPVITLTDSTGADVTESYIGQYTTSELNSLGGELDGFQIPVNSNIPVGKYTLSMTLTHITKPAIPVGEATITVVEDGGEEQPYFEWTGDANNTDLAEIGQTLTLKYTLNTEALFVLVDGEYAPVGDSVRDCLEEYGFKYDIHTTIADGKTEVVVKIFLTYTGLSVTRITAVLPDGNEVSNYCYCTFVSEEELNKQLSAMKYSFETHFADRIVEGGLDYDVYTRICNTLTDEDITVMEKYSFIAEIEVDMNNYFDGEQTVDVEAAMAAARARMDERLTVSDFLRGAYLIMEDGYNVLYDFGMMQIPEGDLAAYFIGIDEYYLMQATDEMIVNGFYEYMTTVMNDPSMIPEMIAMWKYVEAAHDAYLLAVESGEGVAEAFASYQTQVEAFAEIIMQIPM